MLPPTLASAVEVDRDAAREAALRELSDPRYAADDPTLLERAARWAFTSLSDLIDDLVRVVPGGAWGVVIAVALGAVIVVGLIIAGRRVLRERQAIKTARPLFADAATLGAAEHRSLAMKAQQDGQWDEAVRAWLRAMIRDLEERRLLAPRPGRTADEAAREAAAIAPSDRDSLALAASLFDAVTFGSSHATADDAHVVGALAQQMMAAKATPSLRAPR